MKYWAYLAAKLGALGGLLAGVRALFDAYWPMPAPFVFHVEGRREEIRLDPLTTDLGYAAAVMAVGLVAVGLLYLIILDQRYRCRTCLRRLRMPVTSGSWDHTMLLGPPRTEYICPFGHGTLRVPDIHLATDEKTDWRPIENMWRELEELEESHK